MTQEISSTDEKWCLACEKFKPYDAFNRDRARVDGYYPYCKACRTAIQRVSRERNPVDPERLRRAHWKRTYGLTYEEYMAMFEAQGGVCASCGQPEKVLDSRTGQQRYLAVDHCHQTGKVRALLCGACNYAFGVLEEDPERIALLLAYARKHKCEPVPVLGHAVSGEGAK